MGKELNSWIVAIVRPPLMVVRFVVEKSYSLLFGWWLDRWLVNRSNQRFADEIRRHLTFLFDDYGAQIVLNDREPPASFDFALVTISAGNLIFRVFRGRGDITMRVASTRAPNDWHEVSAVLSVMDVGVERQAFRNPADIARVLRPHMAEMEEAFSGDRHSEVERRLSDIYAHDGAVTRQWETEINRRLYPDR